MGSKQNLSLFVVMFSLFFIFAYICSPLVVVLHKHTSPAFLVIKKWYRYLKKNQTLLSFFYLPKDFLYTKLLLSKIGHVPRRISFIIYRQVNVTRATDNHGDSDSV